MKYNLYDKEFEVLEEISDLPLNKIYYEDNDELDLFNKMKNTKCWMDNTKGSPDLISEKFKTMIECMQINDYTEKGITNSFAKDNNEIIKEIDKAFDVKQTFPNLKNIFIDKEVLPEYCSIDNYKKMCHRVIPKHINNIPKYRSNYSGFKLVFLIIDLTETTYYVKLDNDLASLPVIEWHPIMDENIMSIFLDKDIDYILWYRPFLQHSILKQLTFINNRRLTSFVNKFRKN